MGLFLTINFCVLVMTIGFMFVCRKMLKQQRQEFDRFLELRRLSDIPKVMSFRLYFGMWYNIKIRYHEPNPFDPNTVYYLTPTAWVDDRELKTEHFNIRVEE